MKTYVRKEKEEGVSPVIATILMVAITVVLAATLYLMVGNMGGGGDVTPPITFQSKKLAQHKWQLEVVADGINPVDLKYAVIGSDGTTIATGSFPTTSGANDTNGVTWNDLNGNNKVDSGDSIVIWNSSVDSGDTFKITSGATGSVELS